MNNQALVLIKPHCAGSAAFAELVETVLANHGIRVLERGERAGAEVALRADAHYGDIARYARESEFMLHRVLSMPADKIAKLRGTLNVSVEYLASHIATAQQAMGKVGDAKVLEREWRSGPYFKLQSGIYIAKACGMYVINGFYPAMIAPWNDTESARVRYYAVEWDEEELTWTRFRDEVIGETDPSKANPRSIRGLLHADPARYGLERAVIPFNGVHASECGASGAREICLWCRSTEPLLRTSLPATKWEVLERLGPDLTELWSTERVYQLLKE